MAQGESRPRRKRRARLVVALRLCPAGKAYEDSFRAVPDHLVIVHLDGPVGVSRILGKSLERRTVTPGGWFVLTGGVDFGVELEGQLESLHVYLRDAVLRQVAPSSSAAIPL
ncbi:MAG: hypothetical protein JOY71_03400 [Acetobacteraceae bacterium]|nr:hypothetical protein [Acetobacteraceae bacterium]